MKVILINPPIRTTDPPIDFPSGLGYISAVLLREGHHVKALDINGCRYDQKRVERLLNQYLIKEDFKIIGIGCLITCYNYIKWLIKTIRKIRPETKIIVGGGLGSSIPKIVIENLGADISVVGEGEYVMLDLLKNFKNGKFRNLSRIRGIYFKNQGKIIKTELRKPIQNLDEVPFPAWHLFPMHIYLKNLWGEIKNMGIKSKNSVNIVCGRGCPYNCTFCYDPLGHTRRIRSVENVLEEIDLLRKKYGVDFIFFGDPIFMTDKKWVHELCDKMINQKMNIKWVSAGRVNLLDEELLKKMKSAGCISINLGIESGSQKMLNIMRKGFTPQMAYRAIEMIRNIGLREWLSFMMGFPEETEETLEETIKFCIKNDINLISIFFVTPYPGTALYEQVKIMSLIKDEEEYISKLGDATELTINLTRWDNKKLFKLRNHIIKKVRGAYFKRHKLEYITWIIKKQKWYFNYIKTHGLSNFLNEAKNKVAGITK